MALENFGAGLILMQVEQGPRARKGLCVVAAALISGK